MFPVSMGQVPQAVPRQPNSDLLVRYPLRYMARARAPVTANTSGVLRLGVIKFAIMDDKRQPYCEHRKTARQSIG